MDCALFWAGAGNVYHHRHFVFHREWTMYISASSAYQWHCTLPSSPSVRVRWWLRLRVSMAVTVLLLWLCCCDCIVVIWLSYCDCIIVTVLLWLYWVIVTVLLWVYCCDYIVVTILLWLYRVVDADLKRGTLPLCLTPEVLLILNHGFEHLADLSSQDQRLQSELTYVEDTVNNTQSLRVSEQEHVYKTATPQPKTCTHHSSVYTTPPPKIYTHHNPRQTTLQPKTYNTTARHTQPSIYNTTTKNIHPPQLSIHNTTT